jgi:hypothetical protein
VAAVPGDVSPTPPKKKMFMCDTHVNITENILS